MEAARVTTPPMLERLTWEEICRMYPDEWVMMAEIDRAEEDDPAVRSAVVVGHAKSRKEAYHSTRDIMTIYRSGACRYTGKPRRSDTPISLFFDLRR